ncbi:integrase core domain-containing protein [Variovorax sp. J22R115]|uniref:integrase core domain-containing protein n=1 Tax=Variovorax sp. J22R115 TaxID=3053509 RepID=UPI002574C410|nr:integrase core domain-containing protein [Variovorax sp. J22R115]MDM0053756.1 integrase core domain-containing protein [Variovorax sp. J22R115]
MRSPFRSPKANAICERVIGTIRRECLDWMIPLSETHLRSTLREWISHYNGGRPHTFLGPGAPGPPAGHALASKPEPDITGCRAHRCERNLCSADCITNTRWRRSSRARSRASQVRPTCRNRSERAAVDPLHRRGRYSCGRQATTAAMPGSKRTDTGETHVPCRY